MSDDKILKLIIGPNLLFDYFTSVSKLESNHFKIWKEIMKDLLRWVQRAQVG